MDALPQDLGDRYVIERELGHGASATVYLARDLKFDGRLVAIKILSPDFALAVPAERFLREIRTTAKLNHPHIVSLFDSGTTQGNQTRPFYVMRFIDGEVLRGIIARGPIPIAEALRVTRQAASALSHAHRHGVIHRDIKPGNIMLEDGHTWVTDFGIARAMASDDRSTVTSTGVTIGTPAYMSPEQAMGHADLDGRSDIYSLGCVLYEMLAGRMPFDGPDIQSVMNKHLVEPLQAIRELRPDVPERVEQLLSIALAKRREDRFPSAAEFAEALSLEGAGALTPTRTQPAPGERRKRPRWKPRTAAVAGATLGIGVLTMVAAWVLTRPTLKTDRYLVTADWLYGEGANASMDAGRLLQDQLNQWKGITVMGSNLASSGRPGAAARQVEAAWYVRGGVSRVGDSLRIRAQLYGTHGDSLVRERSVNVPLTPVSSDSAFSRLADGLLFDDTVWAANGGRAGTRSVEARRAFARGLASVQRWDLAGADSAFRNASDTDPGYASAHLWLAQVRYWLDAPMATWRSSSERAHASRSSLSRRDEALSVALVTLGRGDIRGAGRSWEHLTQMFPSDFAAWYGLASCLNRDNAVVPASGSPSGWRFRTSYHRITKAYQRAFELLPSIHRALRGGSYEFVRSVLMTNASTVRYGQALPPDTTRFRAYPSWDGDTLALVPYPSNRLFIPKTLPAAVRHERELFHDIAVAWVTAFPGSAEALEALALSLDMLGDPSAVDSLHRARILAAAEPERVRIAGAEFWMRLRFSVPFDTRGTQAAKALADSLLSTNFAADTPEPLLLASIAVATGRANLAADFTRRPAAVEALRVPPPLARIAGPLLVFSALAGPLDSVRTLEAQTAATIENAIAAPQQIRARMS